MGSSLYVECWQEAAKHQWIESQKHGSDLGDFAVRDWFRRHWPIFCRVARLQHLAGIRAWVEFPQEHYGMLDRIQAEEDQETFEWIMERAWRGYENLNLIDDARTLKKSMDHVINILIRLHLNMAQLEPPQIGPPRFAAARTIQFECVEEVA